LYFPLLNYHTSRTFAIAFIVEGDCEYDCFPGFVSKILGYETSLPIANARGIGNIVNNLDELLLLLVKSNKPKKIIITLDLKDALEQRMARNCIELKEKVENSAQRWLRNQEFGSLVESLPHEVVVVIADKTYDAWLCSDVEGLKRCPLINPSKITSAYSNVDCEIPNPIIWLKDKCISNIDLKSRRHRKEIAKSINPSIGKDHSRSFRKFYKEVINCRIY
jgi:hypothetical protein